MNKVKSLDAAYERSALKDGLRFNPVFEENTQLLNWGQPIPIKNKEIHIDTLVKGDIQSRSDMGLKKYGTRLQPNNGRDSLKDAYEEALDLCQYLRQALYERDGK